MKFLYLFLGLSITIFIVFACDSNQNNSRPEKEENVYKNTNDVKFSDEVNKELDTSLFNPYYMPFYGNLTMAKLFKLYKHNSTASGPGNSFSINCYDNYNDSATGTYHYYWGFEQHCDVNVSIWKKGFYDGDTTQRINSIYIGNKNCKINSFFPLKVGQIISNECDSTMFVSCNTCVYREKDYIFLLYVENKLIEAIFIKRLYCHDEIKLESIISWFEQYSVQYIRRNKVDAK